MVGEGPLDKVAMENVSEEVMRLGWHSHDEKESGTGRSGEE